MQYIRLTKLTITQKRAVTNLWNQVFPASLAFKDIRDLDQFLNNVKDVHFILALNIVDEVQGCFIDFVRDEKRFFSLLIADTAQGKGVGTELLSQAKATNDELHGWMVDVAGYERSDGQEYKSPVGFYIKNNFKIVPEERLDSEKIQSVKVRWEK